MKTEFNDFPPKLAEMIGKPLIASLSLRTNVAQKRWCFDMFLDIDEPHAFASDYWILRADYNGDIPRMLVNFNYEPFKYTKSMHSQVSLFFEYYKLNKAFAELNPSVNWQHLKQAKMVHGLNFESWLMFFELSYPKDHKFYISSIIKNFTND